MKLPEPETGTGVLPGDSTGAGLFPAGAGAGEGVGAGDDPLTTDATSDSGMVCVVPSTNVTR